VAEHGAAELGLKPGTSGRKDAAGIGDGHEILKMRSLMLVGNMLKAQAYSPLFTSFFN